MIKCPCGLAFVDKTTRCINTCTAEHVISIRSNDQKKKTVAVHFNALKHNFSTLQYIGIEHVFTPRRREDIDNLLRREAFYMLNIGYCLLGVSRQRLIFNLLFDDSSLTYSYSKVYIWLCLHVRVYINMYCDCLCFYNSNDL